MAQYYYFKANGKRLRLAHPVNYSEKLWWLILYNHDPLMKKCTDKLAVREYVADRGLGGILNQLIGVYHAPTEIPFSELPPRAFIKTTHGSGGNALWDASVPFDMKLFHWRFSLSLAQNFFYRRREWNYDGLEPRLIVEREIQFGPSLVDYRMLCFHGEFKLAFVDIGTAAHDGTHAPDAMRNVHDREFNVLPVRAHRPTYKEPVIPKPANWNEMIRCAEILAEPFAHCRVDLYSNGQKIVFGELTFYPGGGGQPVQPASFHDEMGSWIDLGKNVTRNSEKL